MATRTFTATVGIPDQPRLAVQGPIVRMVNYTVSVDAADVLIFSQIKIPTRSVIHEYTVRSQCDTASTTTISMVITAGFWHPSSTGLAVIYGSATFDGALPQAKDFVLGEGQPLAAVVPGPKTISFSDSDAQRFVVPRLVIDSFGGSVTGSRTLQLAIRISYSNLA